MDRPNLGPCNLLGEIPCLTSSAEHVDPQHCDRAHCALSQLNQDKIELSNLLQHLPGMAFKRAVPDNGRFTYISKGCRDITGISAEEICADSSKWFRLIHDDWRDGALTIIERALQQRHPYLAIYKIIAVNGVESWVWEQGKPIFDDNGEPYAVEGYIASLSATANGQLDAALLNEQLSQIVQHSDQVFWVASVLTNEIIYISPAFNEIWGFDRQQLKQNPSLWLDCVDPKHRRSVELAQAVDFNYYGKKTITIEYQIRRPDGERRWIRARFSPLFDRDGGCIGRGGVATDITEEKGLSELCDAANRQLEADLKRRQQQLETLIQEKSQLDKLAATAQMAAGIAHEINNPLAGIKNAVALMKSAIPAEHPHLRYADMAERELERLAGITRQMYQLNQPVREAHSNVDLDRLLEDTLALCKPELDAKKLRATVAYANDSTALKLPDNDLRQILLNIIKNAIDASPEDAEIRVRCCCASDSLHIAVHNVGPEISPTIREKIFEPFFTTKSGKNKGLGLGLAVSHSLVRQHGGEIRVDSCTEETVFTVCLPL